MKTGKALLARQVPLKVIAAAGLFLSALFAFAYIADEAVLEKEDVFDRSCACVFFSAFVALAGAGDARFHVYRFQLFFYFLRMY